MSPMQNSELYLAISKQLVRMLARNLDHAPQAEELPLCAQVMTDDLMNCGYTDGEALKVAEAIDRYGRTAQRWPTTRDIQSALRDIAQHNYMNRNDYKSLPEPDGEKQRRKAVGLENLEKIKKMLRETTKALPYNKKQRAAKPDYDEAELLAKLPPAKGMFEDLNVDVMKL